MVLVSVVVPTYDRPDRVERAVESVANQSHTDIELVVVDDCSPTPVDESTLDVPSSRFDGVQFLRHDENRGGAAARNTGMDAASGEYLAFLDDDDEWEPTKVEKQVAAFRRAPDSVGVVYTGIRQVNDRGETNTVTTPDVAGDVTKQLLRRNFIGSFSAVMIATDVIDQVGDIDERFVNWHDWEYYLRISTVAEFAAITEPLVRRHAGTHHRLSQEYEVKRDVTSPLFVGKFSDLAAKLEMENEFRGYQSFHVAHALFMNGEFRDGRRYVLDAICRYPWEPTFYVYLGLLSGGRYTFEPVQYLKRRVVHVLDRLAVSR